MDSQEKIQKRASIIGTYSIYSQLHYILWTKELERDEAVHYWYYRDKRLISISIKEVKDG